MEPEPISKREINHYLMRLLSVKEAEEGQETAAYVRKNGGNLATPAFQMERARLKSAMYVSMLEEAESKLGGVSLELRDYALQRIAGWAKSAAKEEIANMSRRLGNDKSSPLYQKLSTQIHLGMESAVASKIADIRFNRKLNSRSEVPRSDQGNIAIGKVGNLAIVSGSSGTLSAQAGTKIRNNHAARRSPFGLLLSVLELLIDKIKSLWWALF